MNQLSQRAKREVMEDSRQRLEFPRLLELVASYASSRVAKDAVAGLAPACDIESMERVLAEVEEVRLLLRDRVAFRLDVLFDLPTLLDPSSGSADRILSPEELHRFRLFLDCHRSLRATLAKRADAPRLRSHLDGSQAPPGLRERLERSVNGKGEVLSTATTELAALRDRVERLEGELRAWMEKRRQAAPLRGVLQGEVVTIRNGRFVFAVRAERRQRVPGLVHGESATGATLYIEPQEIILRGNELSSHRARERREIERVLAELTSAVRSQREALVAIFEVLRGIDMTLARARFAESFGCTAPELTRERNLRLVTVRHPLLLWRERDPTAGTLEINLDEAGDRVVPLDLELGRAAHQMVVTGPNTGGKTVVLKTVGLSVLMAYCGIPIPTPQVCRIPLFDTVFADIGDEQSLEQNLSTFSAHMTVIGRIARHLSSRSLVLIDELGAGTDPLEGAALGEAILDRLYERGAFSLVTTHLGRLKEVAFRRRKCVNAAMEFDAVRLAPTYRLLLGVPGRSNAMVIARRIGIPKELVDRAEELLAGADRLDAAVLDGMERTRRDLERRRGEMERLRREAQQLERSTAEELESVRALRAAQEHELEQAEEERVRSVIAAVEEALRAFGEPPRDRREAYEKLRATLAEARTGTSLNRRRLECARGLRKGDSVFVPKFRSVCEIRKINKTKEILTVSMNGIPVEVAFQDISWILPPPGFEVEWYE